MKLGVTAQMSARVGASLLEMKPFCRMPRGFLSPVIISRVCLTATSLRSRPAPLIFYFFTLMGKNFLEPEKFFFSRCTCFESNFCPPRFLNLTNSPRLNCKDSPRTSSALALNYAELMTDRKISYVACIWQGAERTSPSSCGARWRSALPDRSSCHLLEIRTRPTSSSTSTPCAVYICIL